MQKPRSPAAQAIVKAFDDRYELLGPLEDDWQEQCIATALGALADQVVCANPTGAPDCCISIMEVIRADILAIATELEGQ
jgi:hypothetical protein